MFLTQFIKGNHTLKIKGAKNRTHNPPELPLCSEDVSKFRTVGM